MRVPASYTDLLRRDHRRRSQGVEVKRKWENVNCVRKGVRKTLSNDLVNGVRHIKKRVSVWKCEKH